MMKKFLYSTKNKFHNILTNGTISCFFRKILPSKKYVLFVSPTYFDLNSVIGGGERYSVELAKSMSNFKKVKFVSFGDNEKVIKNNNLEIIIYKPIFKLFNSQFHPLNLKIIKDIWSAEVIHCFQYRTFPTFIALIVAKLFGKNTFVTDLGSGSNNFLINNLYRLTDKFLIISKFAGKMIKAPDYKKTVIYGAVDINRFKGMNNENRKDYFLFVGRIMPHKGIDILIKVLLAHEQLMVVGKVYDKTYFNDLKKMSKGKNVKFLTKIGDKSLIKLYRQANICVLPSIEKDMYGNTYPQSELLGLVLLEAMACGTPVVGSNIGGIKEIFHGKKVGYLFKPGDTKSLRMAIDKINESPQVWRVLSENARNLVRNKFSWDSVAQHCIQIYEEK